MDGERVNSPAITNSPAPVSFPLPYAAAERQSWRAIAAGLRDHGRKGLAIEALSAVDIALWDLQARHLGQPVHRLLGGPLRKAVEATGLYRKRPSGPNNHDPLSYLVEEAHQRAAEGFSAIKLKLGFGLDGDVRLCQMARRAVGDGMTIMIDGNHAYNATAAIRLGRHGEALDIAWCEEPVMPEDRRRQGRAPPRSVGRF